MGTRLTGGLLAPRVPTESIDMMATIGLMSSNDHAMLIPFLPKTKENTAEAVNAMAV